MEILLRFVPTNSLRLTASRIILTHVAHYTRLAEVGKLEAPKTSGKYETGQLILHKVFGYRGVILFPWLARVYDRDATNKKDSTEPSGSTDTSRDNLSNVGKEVKGRTHTFYQVLIDTRDAPYICEKQIAKIDDKNPKIKCHGCERQICVKCSGLLATELRVVILQSPTLKYLCPDCELGVRQLPALRKLVTQLQYEINELKCKQNPLVLLHLSSLSSLIVSGVVVHY
ncbi:unnamed protein product [Euphydryas editha]|uniref:Hemimethylated DNA-binding domain-containing protein n=1 Tax=Euphydryas editha TaxID=104508 RepID=A0AAU9U7I0_EUPED|nr:unnamed protein product [Euphydryas editha]